MGASGISNMYVKFYQQLSGAHVQGATDLCKCDMKLWHQIIEVIPSIPEVSYRHFNAQILSNNVTTQWMGFWHSYVKMCIIVLWQYSRHHGSMPL